MNSSATREDQKRAAAIEGVGEIEDGMIVGLGTGSTVAYAIEALGRRVAGGLAIRAVATSIRTEAAAEAAGIPILDFSGVAAIDLCIDGVDEIDARFRAIKGAGGAMLREKIVAAAATRMIAIADCSKRVEQLGRAAVPVEILPFALAFAERNIEILGGTPALRLRDGGPWRSDQGNFILDCHFGLLANVAELARALSAVPGILGHGLFLGEIDAFYVGTATGVIRSDR